MTQITISLDEDTAAQLRELAQQRGESVEQIAQQLLTSTLPLAMSRLDPDDPDGSGLILSMSGSLTWPGSEGTVGTTNEEIDHIVAAEAMNPHDDE